MEAKYDGWLAGWLTSNTISLIVGLAVKLRGIN